MDRQASAEVGALLDMARPDPRPPHPRLQLRPQSSLAASRAQASIHMTPHRGLKQGLISKIRNVILGHGDRQCNLPVTVWVATRTNRSVCGVYNYKANDHVSFAKDFSLIVSAILQIMNVVNSGCAAAGRK